ncbi:hypothetical protein [Micromonospora sp. KC723]|uniref:hypothetical protein n=1 Tax=Micromonospora sp. KC723 TaxID=2530381 RepID=UPI00104C653A|nr:hypothetical protein [Micromonospora sp. KC723]TDB77446.1 hypothetical protein E1165_03960 [Micromonospora sp. KC723]
MTLPHAGTENVADPGSIDPDTMAEPDTGEPGDLDADHQRLARDRFAEPHTDGVPSVAESSGSPVGPPD